MTKLTKLAFIALLLTTTFTSACDSLPKGEEDKIVCSIKISHGVRTKVCKKKSELRGCINKSPFATLAPSAPLAPVAPSAPLAKVAPSAPVPSFFGW